MSPDGYTGAPWANHGHSKFDPKYLEFALAAHMRDEHGMRLVDIARRIKVPYNTVRAWLAIAEEDADEPCHACRTMNKGQEYHDAFHKEDADE